MISEHLRLRSVDCVKLERVTKEGFGAELVFVPVLYVSGSQSRGRDPLGGRETVRGGREMIYRNQINVFKY